jgi:hypothetical protein
MCLLPKNQQSIHQKLGYSASPFVVLFSAYYSSSSYPPYHPPIPCTPPIHKYFVSETRHLSSKRSIHRTVFHSTRIPSFSSSSFNISRFLAFFHIITFHRINPSSIKLDNAIRVLPSTSPHIRRSFLPTTPMFLRSQTS